MTDMDYTVAHLRLAIAQTSDPKHRRIAEAMMLLLTLAAAQGAGNARLVKRTKLPLDFVEAVVTRMWAAGLCADDDVDTRGWRDEHNELIAHDLFGQVPLAMGE